MALEELLARTTRVAPSAPMRETRISPKMLAGFSGLDSSRPVLTNASRRISDREITPRNQAWTPLGASCLRCGGLLAPSYTASLERDITGGLVRLWRCVNCGDCLDSIILANRWKKPVPACETANWRANIVCRQPVMTGVLEVRAPKAGEGKKAAITVKIDRVLVV
jgi:hypothetical protein